MLQIDTLRKLLNRLVNTRLITLKVATLKTANEGEKLYHFESGTTGYGLIYSDNNYNIPMNIKIEDFVLLSNMEVLFVVVSQEEFDKWCNEGNVRPPSMETIKASVEEMLDMKMSKEE